MDNEKKLKLTSMKDFVEKFDKERQEGSQMTKEEIEKEFQRTGMNISSIRVLVDDGRRALGLYTEWKEDNDDIRNLENADEACEEAMNVFDLMERLTDNVSESFNRLSGAIKS